MPFVEIVNQRLEPTWVKFTVKTLKISIGLMDHIKENSKKKDELRIRLFYDKENKLFGIKPDVDGYKLVEGRIDSRRLPKALIGKFEAKWDEDKKMIVADLTQKL